LSLSLHVSMYKPRLFGHQPIAGLYFVDWQTICILGHALIILL